MPLSCSIFDYNVDSDSWYFYPPEDYSTYTRPRRKGCSCGKMVAQGNLCTKFFRSRPCRSLIEEIIHGDEVPLAPMYLCEACSDLYFSFIELGFVAVCPAENMIELAKEYASTYQSNSL